MSSKKIWWIAGAVVLLLSVGVLGKKQGWWGQTAEEIEVEVANVERRSIGARRNSGSACHLNGQRRTADDHSGLFANVVTCLTRRTGVGDSEGNHRDGNHPDPLRFFLQKQGGADDARRRDDVLAFSDGHRCGRGQESGVRRQNGNPEA